MCVCVCACARARVSPCTTQLAVCQYFEALISMYSLRDSCCLRHIGAGVLGKGYMDMCFSGVGELVVADADHHRVCVFTPDGTLMRSFGTRGVGSLQFLYPTALATHGMQLFVLERDGAQ